MFELQFYVTRRGLVDHEKPRYNIVRKKNQDQLPKGSDHERAARDPDQVPDGSRDEPQRSNVPGPSRDRRAAYGRVAYGGREPYRTVLTGMGRGSSRKILLPGQSA